MNEKIFSSYPERISWNGTQSRREVLRMAGAACLVLGGMSCAGMTRAGMVEPVGKSAAGGLTAAEREVLRLASLAPSGHNTQPWTVRVVGKGRWVIGFDAARALPAVDPGNRELLLSLGAFLENLVLAAGAMGMRAEYSVMAGKPHDRDVLEVRLEEDRKSQDRTGTIIARRTIRKGMLMREIASADLASLCGKDSSAIFLSHGSAGAEWIAGSTMEANRAQAYRNEAQEELANWIRWRDADVMKHRNGLTPAGMEIDGIAGWFVRHFYDRGSVLEKDFRERTVDLVAGQVREGGGWIVMTSRDSTVPELVETGRRFQRLLLGARERMIAVHPMTQALEEAPWRTEAARAIGADGSVQFILRVGYVTRYPDPVSPRMPVEWFVTSSS